MSTVLPNGVRGDAGPGAYRMGTVVQLTGLTAHTIRVWESRYGAVSPSRSEGGTRLYAEEDVQRLRLLKRLVDQGGAIGAIAVLPTEQLRSMAAQPPATDDGQVARAASRLVGEFLDAASCLDTAAAEQVLGRVTLALSPLELLEHFLDPVLRDMGTRWERGGLRVAHEHAASAQIRNLLGALLRLYAQPASAPALVAATPAGERHELGALMAAVRSALGGFRVVYLGPDLPAVEVAHAVNRAAAAAVLVSVVSVADAGTWLRELVHHLDSHPRLLVGGRGADQAVATGGGQVVRNFAELDVYLREIQEAAVRG